MSEAHLRSILREWTSHYNQGRPHSSLGPGVPDPPKQGVKVPKSAFRQGSAADVLIRVKSILNGLHHEYSLAATLADV
jgi:transposase InsO family protein